MKYKVSCKYCGNRQNFSLEDLNNPDIESIEEAIKYDQEYICSKCGCFVRVGEAIDALPTGEEEGLYGMTPEFMPD